MTKIKDSGKFHGKSNKLGHGGRAAQLKAQGVPGGVIGELARRAHAAPGQANYHGKKMKHYKHRKEHSEEAKKGLEKFAEEEATEKKHYKHKKSMCKVCGKPLDGEHKHNSPKAELEHDKNYKEDKHYKHKKVNLEDTAHSSYEEPEPKKKMSKMSKEKRHKTMLSNAATKMFSRNFS